MTLNDTLLVVPPNDPEAILIVQISRVIGLPLMLIQQPHGANLDREEGAFDRIMTSGQSCVVTIEIPGPQTEDLLRRKGKEVILIDHHEYDGLDRAHTPSGDRLPSSLFQFLDLFQVTDEQLQASGFDPRLVRGIGLLDGVFVWGLREDGYSEGEILSVVAYAKSLMESVRGPIDDTRKQSVVAQMWNEHTEWNGVRIFLNPTDLQVRNGLSLFLALREQERRPCILLEPQRGFVYMQETPSAKALFDRFGGFTFGDGNNWGVRGTPGSLPVSLDTLKDVLATSL